MLAHQNKAGYSSFILTQMLDKSKEIGNASLIFVVIPHQDQKRGCQGISSACKSNAIIRHKTNK